MKNNEIVRKNVKALEELARNYEVIEKFGYKQGFKYDRIVVNKLNSTKYLVRDDGETRWCNASGTKVVRPVKDIHNGKYKYVRNGLYVYEHTLVCFVYNRSEKVEDIITSVVNHMDLSSEDKDASNLEFITSSENIIHGFVYRFLINNNLIKVGAKLSGKGLYKGIIEEYRKRPVELVKYLVQMNNIDKNETILGGC